MKSPITGTSHVVFENKIKVSDIVQGYQSTFGINVSDYFKGIEYIEIYKCTATGYRFYYPFCVSGDGHFYDFLQTFEWYYPAWKWEYEVVFHILKNCKQVLEIGCGNGAFLKKIQEVGVICTGLELSEDAVSMGKKSGLNIVNLSIEEFANHQNEVFDAVCAFQLLEHISDVKSLIESALSVLKSGGRLLLAVPNNDLLFFRYPKSYLDSWVNHQYQMTRLLNMPPHHMGMWNANSLKNLQNVFPIVLEDLIKEPLSDHRKRLNVQILFDKVGRYRRLLDMLKPTDAQLLLMRIFKSEFKYSDTIIAVFVKK